MTKYYVGYTQGNGEYVYVSDIDNYNVKVSTIIEGAIGFDNQELAKALVDIVKTIVSNQDYIVLEIKTTIKEVK